MFGALGIVAKAAAPHAGTVAVAGSKIIGSLLVAKNAAMFADKQVEILNTTFHTVKDAAVAQAKPDFGFTSTQEPAA
jgi:hypothetical protein